MKPSNHFIPFPLRLMIAPSLLMLGAGANGAEKPARPNVVLIYTDDLGFGDVGCYGAKGVATPNIDRLATEGIQFTDGHCSAATCTPSRFAMLSGQYAFRQKGTGVLPGDAQIAFPPEMTTLPEIFKEAGYATAVVGKWHLGLGDGSEKLNWNKRIAPGPNEIGFDYSFIMPATNDRVPCVYVENGDVVNLDPDDPIEVSYKKRIGDAPTGKERPDLLKQKWSKGHDATIVNGVSRIGYMTGGGKARWVDEDMADTFTGKALDFIDANHKQPFFLYFATHDVHVPRVPHARHVGKSAMGPRGDAIAQLDWCVGALLEKLDALGLTENTMVIFTSDNGPVLDDGYDDNANEKLGDHLPAGPFRAGKYSNFEGGTRVPFLVRWPGRVKAGSKSDALLGQVDMTASFAALTGVAIDNDQCVDSAPALDTLLGKDPIGRPHLIHERKDYLSLRQGKWKAILPGKTRDGLGPWENVTIPQPGVLFDTQTDPNETTDLAAKHPAQLEAMKKLLEQIREKPVAKGL